MRRISRGNLKSRFHDCDSEQLEYSGFVSRTGHARSNLSSFRPSRHRLRACYRDRRPISVHRVDRQFIDLLAVRVVLWRRLILDLLPCAGNQRTIAGEDPETLEGGALTLIADDIGGTTARLALASPDAGPRRFVAEQEFRSAGYKGLQPIVEAFLAKTGSHATTACFDVAGPGAGGGNPIDRRRRTVARSASDRMKKGCEMIGRPRMAKPAPWSESCTWLASRYRGSRQ